MYKLFFIHQNKAVQPKKKIFFYHKFTPLLTNNLLYADIKRSYFLG